MVYKTIFVNAIVIYKPATPERFVEENNLLRSRIKSIFICSFHITNITIN